MIPLLLVTIFCLIIMLCMKRYKRHNYKIIATGGGKKRGGSSMLMEDAFLKKNFPNAYVDSWKVALMFLNIRYHFNDYISRMKQIRKHLYNDVLGERSTYGHKYGATPDIINDKPTNRIFETFFYQKCGMTIAAKWKFFPFTKINKHIFSNTVYDNGNNVLDGWEKDKLDKLSKIKNINDIKKDNLNEYNKTVNKCLEAMKNIEKSKINPTFNKEGKYTINGNFGSNVMFSNLVVEWLYSYPPNFNNKYYPNFNLCSKDTSIYKILAIITMNHMPVFTNNIFIKEHFEIKQSPGLMTSSIPDANKKIRQLEWLKDPNSKPTQFYNTGDGKGPPNRMIETYASPLNHNAEVFCSLFPSDRYVSGCIGKFDDNLSKRFKEYKWIPKVIFVNPPYTFDAITNGNRITDKLHSEYPLISVTTLSRRDGGLLHPLIPSYGELPFETYGAKESRLLMNPMLKSKYLKDFIIVPEELFEYEDLFTSRKMFTASRSGAIPTDTIILIKSSMTDSHLAESHLREIQKIIYDEIPKHQASKYKILNESRDDIIKEVMRRSKLLDMDLTEEMLNMIIDNFNRAIS